MFGMSLRSTLGILAGAVVLLLIATPVNAQGGWYTVSVNGQIVTSVGTIQYSKPVLLICGQSKPRVQSSSISFQVGAFYHFDNVELQDLSGNNSSSGWFRVGPSTNYSQVSGCSAPPPPPAPSPQFTFTADQTTLALGQCTTLHWYVAGWNKIYFNGSLSYDNGWGNSVAPVQDTKQVCPQSTTPYTINVTFLNGSTQSKTVTINVSAPPPPPLPTSSAPPPPTSAPPPSINFYADPPTVILPNCSTLRWDVDNARAVYWGSEQVGFHDSRMVCPNSGTAYQLSVTPYSGGSVLKIVTVNVREAPSPQPQMQQPAPQQPIQQPPVQQQQSQQPMYVPPNPQPIVPVVPQNPSSDSSKPDDNSTVLNNDNAGGFLMILGGIALVLRPIIKWLWPGN